MPGNDSADTAQTPPDTRIPVTVLTGYLGAGKTTLLNHILSDDHGRHYAVIVNEFGEIGIDNDLIVDTSEELFEMNNGCVCCSVRGDLIRTLYHLLGTDRSRYDGILIETTGLADPGPVAQTFLVDQTLLAQTRLDSIITVVDARHIDARLADSREAVEQIAFADQILLNKTDLVTPSELTQIAKRIRKLNRLAPIHNTQWASISLEKILERNSFDLERIVKLEPDFLDPFQRESGYEHGSERVLGTEYHGHGEHDDPHVSDAKTEGHTHTADHHHDSDICSISLTCRHPMEEGRLSDWLTSLVAGKGQDILRAKGIIDIQGQNARLVFQAVHMLLEGGYQRTWQPSEDRYSRLVFIGRHLDSEQLKKNFEACAAATSGVTPDSIRD
ncbi:MAG: GTP-binding protein [Burkholderiaceae bacterium]|nr:MAG: GTP-binding protein [Burkholderiaceae bacterium]TAM04125.1 MAG: GTP-binding protein [Pusillimonas sp.]